MSEIFYLLPPEAYRRLVPTVRAYESALLGLYTGGQATQHPSALLAELHTAVAAVGQPALRVTDEGARAMKELMRQIKAEEPGTYELVRPLIQAIGLSGAEAGVLAERLAPWRCTAVAEVLALYERAGASGEAVVVLPDDGK
jgi:hypothetical protein